MSQQADDLLIQEAAQLAQAARCPLRANAGPCKAVLLGCPVCHPKADEADVLIFMRFCVKNKVIA